MSQWFGFYKDRVNSTYQSYFEKRYRPFLDTIANTHSNEILEGGCGIASVSKYFAKDGVKCSGFDLDNRMVRLARKNCPEGHFFYGDIMKLHSRKLVITHGVLEHFDDEHIESILKRFPNSIHYVTLDKSSDTPYGDERLLPWKYWANQFDIKDIETFNNGHDLIFKSNY